LQVCQYVILSGKGYNFFIYNSKFMFFLPYRQTYWSPLHAWSKSNWLPDLLLHDIRYEEVPRGGDKECVGFWGLSLSDHIV